MVDTSAFSTSLQLIEKDETAFADNSRNSLDWRGTYKGVLPCADCESLITELSIDEDSFKIVRIYKGKNSIPIIHKGKIEWNKEGNKICCISEHEKICFLVGENKLLQLDKMGNKIEGGLADKYVLSKENLAVSTVPITETIWLLETINGKKIPLSDKNQQPLSLKLGAADNRFEAFMGCNRIGGAYDIKGNYSIQFFKAMSTMMACENMQTELNFVNILPAISHYQLSNDTLAFFANEKFVLKFVAKKNN